MDTNFEDNNLLADTLSIFVFLEASLVIEVDGGQHAEIRQAAYDDERTTWLRQQGFRVLIFWDHEVLKQLEGVKEAISKSLAVHDSAS